MSAITATPDEAVILDAVEATLLAEWSDLLRRHSPGFVLGLIVQAHDYDPRLGAVMDDCARADCPNLVLGADYCSSRCDDADSEDAEARRHEAARHALADDGPKHWTRGERADIRLSHTMGRGAR